jgi:F420-0:gamma-glutamyl ligase
LIASAGIDESNSETGDYILYPKDPFASAERIWTELRQRWGLDRLGIVVTDSHTSPLRRGVTGVCLSYHGFRGVKSLVDTPDLFDRKLRMTQMNYADGLAAAAVLMMGEAAECQPLAVIANAPVDFSAESRPDEVLIPIEEDLYAPLLQAFLKR